MWHFSALRSQGSRPLKVMGGRIVPKEMAPRQSKLRKARSSLWRRRRRLAYLQLQRQALKLSITESTENVFAEGYPDPQAVTD